MSRSTRYITSDSFDPITGEGNIDITERKEAPTIDQRMDKMEKMFTMMMMKMEEKQSPPPIVM